MTRLNLTVAALLAAGLAMPAAALQNGKTPQGVAYATGGVSRGEISSMYAERDRYSLWVTTAARGSGAYLADVRVVIRDAGGRAVYEGTLDGPWLFIDLPQGRYEVEARLAGEAYKRSTTMHAGDHHQMVFYFDTGDEVSPDRPPPIRSGAAR